MKAKSAMKRIKKIQFSSKDIVLAKGLIWSMQPNSEVIAKEHSSQGFPLWEEGTGGVPPSMDVMSSWKCF